MPPTALAGVWEKIKRAKKHIHELNSVSQAFLQASFHRIVHEDDLNTGYRTFYLERIS